MSLQLAGHDLKKIFNRRVIFDRLSFTLHPGETLLITGPNGSGKSTLVKVLSGVLTPSAGKVTLADEAGPLKGPLHSLVGLVSPYLQMYDEFSPRENLHFALAVRGMATALDRIPTLLERLQLAGRLDDPVRTFSSGMKQRVKYAFALIHEPPIVILDEPMSNLDARGMDLVRTLMEEQRQKGMLVVATNDITDVTSYDVRVDLGSSR
jgi:heme exporter protein A